MTKRQKETLRQNEREGGREVVTERQSQRETERDRGPERGRERQRDRVRQIGRDRDIEIVCAGKRPLLSHSLCPYIYMQAEDRFAQHLSGPRRGDMVDFVRSLCAQYPQPMAAVVAGLPDPHRAWLAANQVIS
jgi:hypothetical protein